MDKGKPKALPGMVSELCRPPAVGAAAQLGVSPSLFQSPQGSCLSTGCIYQGLCQWLQPQKSQGSKKA